MASVGRSIRRKDGPDKLTGRSIYIADLDLPGCWSGATFRSTIPYGKIKRIRFDKSFPWKECVTATAADIPGDNRIQEIEDDQPLLAEDRVMHQGEPIVLVAHPDRATAYEALKHIRVDYEPLDPVLSIKDSLKKKQVLYGTDNVMKRFKIERGDVKKGLARADFIVEGTYTVPHQEQTYIENNGMAAYVDEDGVLVITGSMQCPYFVVKGLAPVFRLPDDKIRVIQTVTGGAFGGKEDYPNMIAGHAALLARKARRPVRILYDRAEDMAATTKRHPAVVRHRTGVTRNGLLVAQDIDILMDAGAYVTMTPVVLSRGILHGTGPYECPNQKLIARALATNTPPNGAFRGFGAPQTLFAAELHWERIAEATGIDTLTLRRRNLLKEGSVLATGQTLKESVGASDCLERTVRKTRYAAKRKSFDAWNRKESNPSWKGIGLSMVHHGPGFTGNGEVFLASTVGIALTRKGRVRVEVANTEMGQGAATSLAQIAADSLGLDPDLVDVQVPDTHRVPNSGPTVASRTCMVVGGLLREAALKLKVDITAALGMPAKKVADLERAAKRLCRGEDSVRYTADYKKPEDIHFDDKSYKGDAYGVYGYACAVTEIEVDKTTFEVKMNRFTTAVDVGKAIHPLIVEGQIMGAAAQGLGYGLLERQIYKDGAVQNPRLTDYIIPTSADAPEMEVLLVEKPYSRGPYGAKGVGELPMNSPAPSAAAAVAHATGLIIPDLPLIPERIEKAFHKRSRGG